MKAKQVLKFTLFAVLIVVITLFIREKLQWWLSDGARKGQLATVKRCVWLGVNVDATPVCDGGANSGEPAFIAAAQGGHDDVVLFLLNQGANINRQDSCGNTALNAAVIRGHSSTAQLLLSRGANPNLRGEGSPLWNADERGDTNLIELLKAHGATE